METCSGCKKKYYRDYYCRPQSRGWSKNHFNGRNCLDCESELHDSLVFFGENLLQEISQESIKEIEEAEFLLIMGTSLVIPSAA